MTCVCHSYAQNQFNETKGNGNPISPAGVFIADPSAKVGPDGKLYIYGSLDENTMFYCSSRYHLLSTDNMEDWTLHQDIFGLDGEKLFASDAAFNNGNSYLYFDKPDDTEWVAEGKSPWGTFSNIRQIEGAKGIDPCVFVDDDGQAYYFWGQFSAKGAKLNPDMMTIDKSTIVEGIVTEKDHHFHEGSFVFKRKGWYYYVFADVSRNQRPTCLGYAMSRSVFGPYEYKGVIIDNNGCDFLTWNNHGSVVEYKGQWYVFYHRATHGCGMMRKACVEPICFREDGTIPEVEMTSQGATGPLDARQQIDASRACYIMGRANIQLMQGTADHEYLADMYHSDKAVFKYLNFGKEEVHKLIIRLKAKNKGRLYISIDNTWNKPVASVKLPASGEWTTLEVGITPISGIHSLWLQAGKTQGTHVCDVDWFRFE